MPYRTVLPHVLFLIVIGAASALNSPPPNATPEEHEDNFNAKMLHHWTSLAGLIGGISFATVFLVVLFAFVLHVFYSHKKAKVISEKTEIP
uniref:Expressed conserved protein n=1 Tax=Steinernema glaseri TaxID=37863 RepID=A0A1I7YXN4_9BILA